MNIINLHKITIDEGSNKERLLSLKKHMLSFFDQPNIDDDLTVMKHCLSLVNDVMEFSQPIRLNKERFSQCTDKAL